MRKAYLDIEVETKDSFPSPSSPKNKVICISLFDDFEHKYEVFLLDQDREYLEDKQRTYKYDHGEYRATVYYCTSEQMLLTLFKKIVLRKNFDLFAGWNVESFDLAYLIKRMQELDINYAELSPIKSVAVFQERNRWKVKIKGRNTFDLQRAYEFQHITGVRSSSLESVSEEELGYGKTGSSSEVDELWRNDPESLIKYNLNDTILCVKLDNKLGLSDFFIKSSQVAACDLEDVYHKSTMFDAFVLSHKNSLENLPEMALPTKEKSKKMSDFEGAVVFPPKKGGVLDNVYVFDLSKIYPSIIIGANISPETIADEDYDGETVDIEVEDRAISFRKNKPGFIPEVLEQMFDMRDRVEKRREKHEVGSDEYEILTNKRQAIKDQINSTYGMLSYRKSRFFLPELEKAELIPQVVTFLGRELLQWSRDRAEELGYKIIYGDTDSIMVEGVEDIKTACELEQMLNESYSRFAEQYNMNPERIRIEFEKRYERAFFKPETKKRYAGLINWKDGEHLENKKLDITGFEYKRSDTPVVLENMQKQLFQRILRGQGEKQICDWLRNLIEEIKNDVEPIDLAIPKGLNKRLDNYEVDSAHVRGAKFSNQHLGANFGIGDKPRYLYVRSPQTDVVCIDENIPLPDNMKVDYEKMLKKTILKKLEPFDEALGWSLVDKLKIDVSDQTKLEGYV